MAESSEFLAERLRSEGDKTISFFSGLDSSQWQATVYTEGETWTVRNVLAHFVTAEKGFVNIFSSIRDGGLGVSEEFDIDRYNASQQKKTRDLTPEELLDQFKLTRAQMISFVGSLSEADLSRQGRHPYLGNTTLLEMIKMVYRHNQIHYRDLRKLISKE